MPKENQNTAKNIDITSRHINLMDTCMESGNCMIFVVDSKDPEPEIPIFTDLIIGGYAAASRFPSSSSGVFYYLTVEGIELWKKQSMKYRQLA